MRLVASASWEKALRITGDLKPVLVSTVVAWTRVPLGELLKFDLDLFVGNKPSFPFSKFSCVSNRKALCSIIKGSPPTARNKG